MEYKYIYKYMSWESPCIFALLWDINDRQRHLEVGSLASMLQVSREGPCSARFIKNRASDMTCVDLRTAGYPTMHFTSTSNRRKVCTSKKECPSTRFRSSRDCACVLNIEKQSLFLSHLQKTKSKLNLICTLFLSSYQPNTHSNCHQRSRDCIAGTITPPRMM